VALSSKKASVLIILLAILVAFLLRTYGLPNSEKSDDLSYQQELRSTILTKDTDGDRLKDWEEQLWGTDINNPDTDGDGTLDGDEVILGRDPTVAGPNDEISVESISREGELEQISEPNSTQQVSQRLLAYYLSLKEAGQLDEENQQEIIDRLLKNLEISVDDLPVYDLADILINTHSESEDISLYKENIDDIIERYSSPTLGRELEVLQLQISIGETINADNLRVSQEAYENIKDGLLKVSPPRLLQNEHLGLINGFAALSFSLLSMQDVLEDPLLTLVALEIYDNGASLATENFDKINATF